MAMTKAHLRSILKIQKPEEVPNKAKNYGTHTVTIFEFISWPSPQYR